MVVSIRSGQREVKSPGSKARLRVYLPDPRAYYMMNTKNDQPFGPAQESLLFTQSVPTGFLWTNV